MADHVIELPVRNPHLFSPEINRQALVAGNLYFVLHSAIQALPHVQESECRENLKRTVRASVVGSGGLRGSVLRGLPGAGLSRDAQNLLC
jgi:hypothetical protein